MDFVISGLAPVLASAGETNGTITNAITGSMQTVANDMLGLISSVVPIVLPIVGAVMLVTLGVRLLKKFKG